MDITPACASVFSLLGGCAAAAFSQRTCCAVLRCSLGGCEPARRVNEAAGATLGKPSDSGATEQYFKWKGRSDLYNMDALPHDHHRPVTSVALGRVVTT